MTTVSLSIPTRNGAPTLERSLRSALAQGADVTTIVFDNASTDETRAVARRHLPDRQIRSAETNLGAVENFARAFTETDGEYFLWLADDDWLNPGFVAAATAALDADPQAVGALPTMHMVDVQGRLVDAVPPNPRLATDGTWRRLLGFLDQTRWSETYAVYRRSSLAPAMPMAECYGGDVVLTWRVLLRGRFCLSPTSVLSYTVDQGKTPEQLAETTAAPGRPQQLRWAKSRLWCRLWVETSQAEVPSRVRFAARLALVAVLPRRTARGHLAEDLRQRLGALPSPVARRTVQRLVTYALLPGSAVTAVRRRARG